MFNTLLILMPVLAAQIVTSAFTHQGFGDSPAIEELTQTRRNMDSAFAEMVPHNEDPRDFWANQIDYELTDMDLTAAQGFLLAAPQMLSREDVKAVQAAAQSQISGSDDERLMRAALLFLRNDVRAKYEEVLRPVRIDIAAAEEAANAVRLAREDMGILGVSAPALGDTPIRDSDLDDEETLAEEAIPNAPQTASASFAVLGDLEDLATHSREWLEDERGSLLILRLEGISISGVQSEGSTQIATAQASSILKSALRAHRLNTNFTRILDQRAAQAVPEKKLRPALEEALAGLVPMSVRGKRVQQAFISSIDERGLQRLQEELGQINRISELTSPTGTITLLQHVEGTEDLRRARMLAEAGGMRAVTLGKRLGDDTLRLADSGIKITMVIALQCMGLAATGMVLLWMMLTALMGSFSRRKPPALI